MAADSLILIAITVLKWFMLSALVLYFVGRSRNSSASTLHFVLSVTFFSVLVLLFVHAYFPKIQLEVISLYYLASSEVGGIIPADQETSENLWVLGAATLYLIVTFVLVLRIALGVFSVLRVLKAAEECRCSKLNHLLAMLSEDLKIRRVIRLCISNETATPYTFGLIKPAIVLPLDSLDWEEGRIRRTLVHELAHVSRFDWFWKMFAQLICAVFWFVPTAWILLRKIEWYAELSCDDTVIAYEKNCIEYAGDLMLYCEQATKYLVGAVALIEASYHYERIYSVLDSCRVRERQLYRVMVYGACTLAFIIVAGCLQVVVRPVYHEINIPLDIQPEKPEVEMTVVDTDPGNGWETSRETYELSLFKSLNSQWVSEDEELVIDVSRPKLPGYQSNSSEINFSLSSFEMPKLHALKKVKPEYPYRAIKRNIEGEVFAEFDVSEYGRPQNIKVFYTGKSKVFRRAVEAALSAYEYKPYYIDGEAVIVLGVTETFTFKLSEDAK